MRRAAQAMWVMGGCMICALAVGPVSAAFGPAEPQPVSAGTMSTTPTLEELASLPECSDADTAAAVHAELAGSVQDPAQGLLASPEDVPPGSATAQGQAWAQLSDEERGFQQCLGAHQALIDPQQP